MACIVETVYRSSDVHRDTSIVASNMASSGPGGVDANPSGNTRVVDTCTILVMSVAVGKTRRRRDARRSALGESIVDMVRRVFAPPTVRPE